MHNIFQHFTETFNKPVLLTCGTDKNNPPIAFVIIVSVLNNDNQEAYSLSSLSMKGAHRCRICQVPKLTMNSSICQFSNADDFRTSSEVVHLLHTNQKNFISFLTAKKNTRINSEYRRVKERLKELGVHEGINPLHDTFNWLNHNAIGNLYTCSSVDILHTLYTGPVEFAIRWSMCCIYLLCKKDSTVIAELDDRIQEMSEPQCLNPFNKWRRFPHGISVFFRNSETHPKAMENAVMTGGGLESQSMPSLLYSLMFAIGTEGSNVCNTSKPELRCNPSKVILQCMTSVLEILWLINSDGIPIDDIHIFETKLNLMNFRLQMLWQLKQKLLCSSKPLAVVKCHLCMHLALNWYLFGRIKGIDTALAEHTHIADKAVFTRTSKRMNSTNQEKLKCISIALRSSTVEYLQLTGDITPSSDDEEITYSVVSNVKAYKIRFNSNTDSWYVPDKRNFFFPWLHMRNLTKLLIKYSEESLENQELIALTLISPVMSCVQAISITPNKASGIDKFVIYATNNYRKMGVSRYDTVEVSYEDSLTFVQIHGIICIDTPEGQRKILLIVHKFRSARKTRTDNLLPYGLWEYDLFSSINIQWDIIEPCMIYRPAILMPCCDRSKGFNICPYNYHMSQSMRFWIIPYSTVDVNGYDICEVNTSELREMEDTFGEINTSVANNFDEDNNSSDGDHNSSEG